MKINHLKIYSKNIYNIRDVAAINAKLIEFLSFNCSEPFCLTLQNFAGETIKALIDIKKLRQFIEEGDFESVEESWSHCGQSEAEETAEAYLRQLLEISGEAQIDYLIID